MAPNPLKVLRDAIKRRQFDGAYYIYGEDEFQKNDAIEQLVDAVIDPATRDFNLEFRQGNELTVETMDGIVSTPPMMADYRLTVVRDVTALKKDVRKRLDTYLANPAPDIVLLLVAAPGAKDDKALVTSSTPLQFDALTGDRIPRWIAHQASTVYGTEITAEAAELLQSAVGSDLYLLSAELDKLASYTNGGLITEAAVGDVVGIVRGETSTDLLDKILERDTAGALALVSHVLMQPKTTAVSIVMGLSTQMLALAWGRARVDDGFPASRLESEFFGLLKRTGAFPMRPWGSAAKAWARAVPDWSAEACERAIDAIHAAEVALKESRVSSDEQILATVILAVGAAGATGNPSRNRRAA